MRLTPPRWPLTQRVGRRHARIDQVMHAARIDPAAAARKDGGRALAEARTTCLDCRHSRACQDLLDAGGGVPLPANFCSNARFLRELMLSIPSGGCV
jgi:Family of unknown function (DUF6455)